MPSKVAYLWQFGFFVSAAPTAQNSPQLKIHIINVAQDTSVYFSMVYWWGSATRKLDGITIQLAPYAAYESRCIACQWRASDNLNLVWQILRNFLCNPDMQKMLIFLFAQWIFNGKLICNTNQISRRVLGKVEEWRLWAISEKKVKIEKRSKSRNRKGV